MIKTDYATRPRPAVCPRPVVKEESSAISGDGYQGPTAGFEPWIGPGKPGHPEPAVCPKPPRPEPVVCPQPTVGIEPWQSGLPTSDPSIGPKYADKLTRAFGDQALLSVKDERIAGCSGYYFQGWESVGGDDFVKGVTEGRLGDQWEMVQYGSYELKSNGIGQRLTFDVQNRQTVLESYYDEHHFDVSRFSETLRLDEDGTMRREIPPVGI